MLKSTIGLYGFNITDINPISIGISMSKNNGKL